MNTSILVLLFVVGVVYSVPTWPAEHDSEDAAWAPLESVMIDHLRFRRATCDLFSFQSQWITPNHAVCAGKCIAMGKRGGECRGTNCHCRG